MHTADNIYKPFTLLATVANLVFVILLTQYTAAYERTVGIFYTLFYYATDVPIFSNNVIVQMPYKPYLYVFFLVAFLIVLADIFIKRFTTVKLHPIGNILYLNLFSMLSHVALAISFIPVMLLSGVVFLDRLIINFFIILLSSVLVSPLLQRKLEYVDISLANFRYLLISGAGFLYVYLSCIITITTSPLVTLRTSPIILLALLMALTMIYILSVVDIVSKFAPEQDKLFDYAFKCRDMYLLTHLFLGCLFAFIIAYLDKKNGTTSLTFDAGIVDLITP